MAVIDTLKLARALHDKGGFSQEAADAPAEALNNALGEDVATKADIAALDNKLDMWMAHGVMTSRIFAAALFALLTVSVSVALAPAAHGEQIVVRNVEYSNDSYTDAGKVVACIVTVAVTEPPDPRVLNFQFLQFKGRVGWKITGGTIDWKNQSATAKRAADGSFSTGTFMHPNAFLKNLTPEGQLVGVLTDGGLSGAFSQAFFKSPYSVSVRWENTIDDLVYYIAQSPPPAVASKFQDCVRTLS